MTRRAFIFFIIVFVCTAAAIWFLQRPKHEGPAGVEFSSIRFEDLLGWTEDDPREALDAFRRSCGALAKKSASEDMGGVGYAGTVGDWVEACNGLSAAAGARAFFEKNFTPFAIAHSGNHDGLFTGYYEPELRASRTKHDAYQTPVYGLPPDLVSIDLGQFRSEFKHEQIAGRIEGHKLVPYAARADIDAHGLPNAPVLFYADDPIDVFFLQIQGSGRVAFDDGTRARVAYAGKNGRVYTAIGRTLISRGALTKESVSMPAIRAWLKANPKDARAVMQKNESYTFFALSPAGDASLGARGTEGVSLTAGASLAVDNRIHPFGAPLFLVTTVPGKPSAKPFRKLLIAQDTGGAIRGAVRGDVYWGAGGDAEFLAGAMKSQGQLYVLLPNRVAAKLGASKTFAVHAP
ncbi:MAG TPA: murein transglycosylase A [Rhizomicrobium sp.]|jgi:membrane-bound lytic murein transglycosylase A